MEYDGVYFLHLSFLKEVSDTWLTSDKISASGTIFMKLAWDFSQGKIRKLITCDRTMKELVKTKYTLKAVPGVFDLVEERNLPADENHLETEAYSFKVASLTRITPHPIYFVVTDSAKEEMRKKAKALGYSINIISTEDFTTSGVC